MSDFTAVESIYFAALGKPAGQERETFLNEACGANAELRQHVDRMLAAHPQVGSFLKAPAPALLATVDQSPIAERPGAVIGPYKLMEQIGEGGFGLVFVAEQQHPMRRKVALKIIKPGMDTRDVIARFEAERQALALMDHPNIARVLDAGATESGRPYFVMELVKGIPIIEYCDQQQLTARQRLELFLSVCQAVQHAHSKGIIHRDLKPSNILVAPHDGVPVVKVIDFGIAKAIGQQLTDKTIYTRFTQMIGTPLYMSPEQAEINALDVDIRSDVYSLGVLLYELLTGTTPFDKKRFATAAYDEIRRIIKEEEPPMPSTRLSTMGESISKVSSQRKTEPTKLSALVKGDLDWIVMKALEKDRSRRYDTASAFAADVRHFLAEEPINARPPSTWYRFQKMARRHRVALTTTALVAGALLIGVVDTIWLAIRATAAEKVARRNEEIAIEERREANLAREKAEQRYVEVAALNEKIRQINYHDDMKSARYAWEENSLHRTTELLEKHRPQGTEVDQRGFEWHYLNRLTHREVLSFNSEVGSALSVNWTPDGHRLLVFGWSQPDTAGIPDLKIAGKVKLWDRASQQFIPYSLKTDGDQAYTGTLSRDGKLLAAGCRDKKIRVWNFETGELKYAMEGHTCGYFIDVVFSPDGKFLASRGTSFDTEAPGENNNRGELLIWDMQTHKAIQSIKNLPGFGHSSFSPNNKYLAYGAADNCLKVHDLVTGQTREEKIGHTVELPMFSPDGKYLAVGSWSRDVQLLDADTFKQVKTFPGSGKLRDRVIFSPDGKTVAASGLDTPLEIWNVESGQMIKTLKGHGSEVFDISFSPDGKELASAGLDGYVKVWDVLNHLDAVPIAMDSLASFKMIKLSPNGQIALTGVGEKTIHLWNAENGKPLGEPINLKFAEVNSDFTGDGKRLEITDAGRNVTVFDTATGKEIISFKHDGIATNVGTEISLDGRWYACAGMKEPIKVWDMEKGVLFRSFNLPKGNTWFNFSPDGSRLAAGDSDGFVRIWELATGRELCVKQLRNVLNIHMMDFSPDGKRIAVLCSVGNTNSRGPREVRILDANTCQEVSPALKGSKPNRITFSHDGKYLATGGLDDGTVKIWDLATGQETLTLKGHSGWVSFLAFSPDGHRLISASGDSTVRTWDATPLPEAHR